MEAWIPEQMVTLEPSGNGYRLFPSQDHGWSAGTGAPTWWRSRWSRKLPWISRQEANPSRIVIDLFGAVSNTNWITHVGTRGKSGPSAMTRWARGRFRITIELTHPQIWGYAIRYRGTRLEVSIRRPPQELHA